MKPIPNLVYHSLPADMPSNYRMSMQNASKLVFNVPLACVRSFRFGWQLALQEARSEAEKPIDHLLLMLAGLVSAPVSIGVLLTQGLLLAAQGRLMHVGFETYRR